MAFFMLEKTEKEVLYNFFLKEMTAKYGEKRQITSFCNHS